MDASESTDFYEYLPVFRDFTNVADETCFTPMPDDWVVGVADVQQSTEAIRQNRYKAVNMAGAAVIASVANALKNRDFPFVFGGDGELCRAIHGHGTRAPGTHRDRNVGEGRPRSEPAHRNGFGRRHPRARQRCARRPLRAIRQYQHRHFSGGGLAWADAAMKRGEIAVPPAPPGAHPDLSGLSCRYELIPAQRGQILSLVVVPGPDARGEDFRAAVEAITRIVEKTPDASRPVTDAGLRLKWPPQGYDLEARASRRAGESVRARKAKVLAATLIYFLIMRLGVPIGRFVPAKYTQQVVENSDFRKFDDSLRMVLDCTPQLIAEIETFLKAAAAKGVVRYGMHRQDSAMVTCFTPSPTNPKHVHFVDGAQGGYALAAAALKTSARA
jgi:hypothetical protein